LPRVAANSRRYPEPLTKARSEKQEARGHGGLSFPRVLRSLEVRGLWGLSLHELGRTLFHFLARQVLLVCGDRPDVAVRIGKRARAIAPELIRQLAHRAMYLGPCGNRLVEDRVAIFNVEPQGHR